MNKSLDELPRFLDRFIAHWNDGDIAGMAARWLPTGDLVSTEGRMAHGPDSIAGLLSEEWGGSLASTRVSMTPTSIRSLAPGIALVDADIEFTSAGSPAGAHGRRLHVVMVAAHRDGAWGFEAVRPYALYSKATRTFAA